MIKGFDSFFESKKDYLMYYAFDWDDNILTMPTKIHIEREVGGKWVESDISTYEFSTVRTESGWRFPNNDPEQSFSEFRDSGPRGEVAFLEDTKKAVLSKKFGPAWSDFLECLVSGSVFAIITARGHESKAIRMGIEWILDNVLSNDQKNEMYNNLLKFSYLFGPSDIKFSRILRGDISDNELVSVYLDNCDFIGVSSPSRGGSAKNPEKAKEIALMTFNSKINGFASSIGAKAKIGFSDDDLKNVKHVEDLIDNLDHEQFPHISQYVVKGTKDPHFITKKVRNVDESSNQSIGMEGSIIPFSQYNSMSSRLFPGNDMESDPTKISLNLSLDHIGKFDFLKKDRVKKSKRLKKSKKT